MGAKDMLKTKSTEPIDLDYFMLAGYRHNYLNYGLDALQAAFPQAKIRPWPTSVTNYEAEAVAVYVTSNEEPDFFVERRAACWDESTGTYKEGFNAGLLVCKNSRVTALGLYRVGETKFSEFSDKYITECGFWIDGSKFICQGTSAETPYSSRFIFEPPSDFCGDFKKASPDILGNAVISEIAFNVGGLYYKRDNGITPPFTEHESAEQIRELLKSQPPALPETCDFKDNSNTLMALLLRSRFDVSDARKAYLSLADIAVYSAEKNVIKDKIKRVFKSKSNADPIDYLLALSDVIENNHKARFLLSFDWKADINELHQQIELAFSTNADTLNLPSPNDFPADTSVSLPDVLIEYIQALNKAGFDFTPFDSQSDTHIYCITPSKNAKRVSSILTKIQV